jgi:diguanylate cyclase (GGDEF)-like protein
MNTTPAIPVRRPGRGLARGSGAWLGAFPAVAAAEVLPLPLDGDAFAWPVAFGALLIVTILLGYYAWRMRRLWRLASRKYLALKHEHLGSTHAMQRKSATDALTGLPNRRSFDEAILQEWQRCRRHNETVALLMIDIDHFKKHNDSHGHQAGDECLRQVARALAVTARRSGDLAARFGGEEFAVLLPSSNVEGAVAVAERIRVAVERIRLPYMDANATRHVTVSIGVAAHVPDDSESPVRLIASADQALYQAKAVGRNQVIVSAESLAKAG